MLLKYILHCDIYDRIKTEDVLHSLKETIEKYKRFAREFEKWWGKESIDVEIDESFQNMV